MTDKGNWIPCQCCGQQYVGESWTWYVCDKCGYRICMNCFSKHSGPYSHGGYKCSQCMMGQMQLVNGIRAVENKPTSKLDEYLSKLKGEQVFNNINNRSNGNLSNTIESISSSSTRTHLQGTTQGIIYTNTSLIARKYKNTCAQDVRDII